MRNRKKRLKIKILKIYAFYSSDSRKEKVNSICGESKLKGIANLHKLNKTE